jgi:hypothetical protein
MQNDDATDATITCQGHTWRVSKDIIAAESEFFRAAMCGNFSEARTSTPDLPEDDSEMVARLLRWIEYDDWGDIAVSMLKRQPNKFPYDPESDMQRSRAAFLAEIDVATDLFAIAHKFGVNSLKDAACWAAREAFNDVWKDDVRIPEEDY